MEPAWLLFPLLGLVAGGLAGLLGIGGGIVLVAALVAVLPGFGVPVGEAMHVALGTSLASIVLTAAASARAHARRGSVLWTSAAWLAPGLAVGGLLGGGLAQELPGDILKAVVGTFCLGIAWRMIQLAPSGAIDVAAAPPRGPGLTLAGLGIGSMSAVVGIGGGSLTVPLLVGRGASPVAAVGTSSACGVLIGLAGALPYALATPSTALPAGVFGHVHVPAALGIALGAVLAAPFGVALAHRLRGPSLARLFALVLALVGLSLWVTVLR